MRNIFVAGNVIKKSTSRDGEMLNTLITTPIFQRNQKGKVEIKRWAAFAKVKIIKIENFMVLSPFINLILDC